jgi:peptide/nickel transport system substrate-binding protein
MRKGGFVFGRFHPVDPVGRSPSQAAKKDTLVIGFSDLFSTLDHYQSTLRATIQLGYMVWDSLVTRNPDTGEINPGLARSWKIINPTTWEFKLQPGVKFHNGNPCNSQAVRYTIEKGSWTRNRNPPRPVISSGSRRSRWWTM